MEEGREVAWECVQVGWLDAIGPGYGGVRNAVGAGRCTFDDLPINPRVPPLSKMVEVLHKHEIPVGVASAEPVYPCRTELWMLSCGRGGESAISGRSSCLESGIVDRVPLPIDR